MTNDQMTDEECIEVLQQIRRRDSSSLVTLEALNHAIARLTPRKPPEGCVRVRVAVIADRFGHLGASGVDLDRTEGQAMSECYEFTKGGPEEFLAMGFLEGDVPRIPVVQGRVVEPEPKAIK